MRQILLAAASSALLAVSFAGCLEDGLSLLTAMEAQRQAQGDADDWADDAELVGAVGFEAGPAAREEIAQLMAAEGRPDAPAGDDGDADERAMFGALSTTEDDDVGDGRAPVWALGYASASKGATLNVVVTSQGVSSVTQGDADDAFFGPLGGRAVADWRVDSDAGADIARDDAGYREAVADPGALVSTMLFQGKDGPVWVYGAESPALDEAEAMVALSASDGKPIDTGELFAEAFGFLIREFGGNGGTVGVQAMGTFGDTFEVALVGHQTLAILVTVTPPPVVPMKMTVKGPDGMVAATSVGAAAALEGRASLVLEEVPVGEYDVQVSVDVAAANNWELSWCTDGAAVIPQGSPACDLVG